MRKDLLEWLRCPACGSRLSLSETRSTDTDVESGDITCVDCRERYEIDRGIPRFVPRANYASSFGFQWNRFRRTQLDSHTGTPISRSRFFNQSQWSSEQLNGKLVLDAGCGAGRFAEIAASTGARVVAVDYSNAVDACVTNLGPNVRLDGVQGDIYRLPFAKQSFDFVYSFGVLQHTPDVERAFKSLVPFVRPGGYIAIDVYPATPLNLVWPKYWLRPLTKRLPAERLYRLVNVMVDWLLPVSTAVGQIPRIGRRLRYAVPVVNYRDVLPLSEEQIREWAVLDTFDMLAPAHDHPKSVQEVHRWFSEAGLTDIAVYRSGLVVGRGRCR